MTARQDPKGLEYALVTPARNEESYIERTLQSVVSQTKPPIRWIIVSDGSTDRTDEIVQGYARNHPWIELLHLADKKDRNFAGKAHAFNTGYQKLCAVPYDIIGNLDADLSFDGEYFAFLLEKFATMPELGVVGTPYVEGAGHYDYRFTNIEHVSGACQLFRRECFEEIGGYVPVKGGGIDWIAVTTARMQGWRTRTFVEKVVFHHRPMGSGMARVWGTWVRLGREDYAMGGHPLWQVARCFYQMKSRPYLLGGILLFYGYASALVKRIPRPVSDELVRFYRNEQMTRLKKVATRFLSMGSRGRNSSNVADWSVEESANRVEQWVEAHNYKGYDPSDGLTSYLRPLTFGNQFLEQVLQQVGRQSPINLRPLLGIKPMESTKGRGYMAWGYLARFKKTGRVEYREKAVGCLEWLIQNKSPLYANASWGNHYDYASRSGKYSKHESIVVWTALIGQAFLDGYEMLGIERYLDVARDICTWIQKLPREETPSGICLSYLAIRQISIHNSNMLGAAMLARTAKHTGSAELRELARESMKYSCTRQLPDGSWYYGEDPKLRWFDSFHTGYNLDNLKCYIESAGDETFRPQFNLGYQYFKANFFETSGLPKYYHNRTYPIDIQCASQAIETLANFADHDPQALRLAGKVARWTIENMQDASGFFYYRRYPLMASKIPMLHWGQATMYRALAFLLLKLDEASGVKIAPSE